MASHWHSPHRQWPPLYELQENRELAHTYKGCGLFSEEMVGWEVAPEEPILIVDRKVIKLIRALFLTCGGSFCKDLTSFHNLLAFLES